MHIEINQTHKNLISVEVEQQEVTTQDIERLKQTIDDLHSTYEHINIMLLVEKHSHTTIKALYKAVRLALSNRKVLHKVAVIGHSNLIKAGVALDNLTMPWQEKYFDIENLDEAWQWITHSS